MGKKGKGKPKITGTPEVQKFKGTKEYALVREAVIVQETVPFVASDILDDAGFRKAARFLNMIGLLAEFCKADESKEYRFKHHHPLVAPPPQYFPSGYPANLIKLARQMKSSTLVKYNDFSFDCNEISPNIADKSDAFLAFLDDRVTKISKFMDQEEKANFAYEGGSLKTFIAGLTKWLKEFDATWIEYESTYLLMKKHMDSEVLTRISELVHAEKKLTEAEESLDIPKKQECENLLTRQLEDLIHANWKIIIGSNEEKKALRFHDDALPLAESIIFYESKCTPEWLNLAKHVIKDYLELRIYIANMPTSRLSLEFDKNTTFVRLLKRFHASVLAAEEAFVFVDQLPKLLYTKTTNWMTRKLLEPDLIRLKKIST